MSNPRYTVKQCAIIILAAGMSRRLGSPKQLLPFQGKSLLQHAVNTALQTSMRPVVVVVGANSNEVKKEMYGMDLEIVENDRWQEGMASSLRCGLDAIQKMPANLDAVIFMVCDQPYVSGSLLDSLVQVQRESGLPIAACSYSDKLGTPALFHKTFFPELMELSGDAGAGKLIKQHEEQVAKVDFPKGSIDIDTIKDYESLLR